MINIKQTILTAMHFSFMYDLIVIGGGSGGMAAAREAARLGAKVLLFDYVKPSTQGTKWGLGGTCVNVGCVPKKLMHYSALISGLMSHDAKSFGHNLDRSFEWFKLVETVQNHIKSLNFSYRISLNSDNLKIIKEFASLSDPHTVEYKDKDNVVSVTAKHILIAVGGRPTIPSSVPGALEYAITSDDIFSLKREPGKTLLVGASYISLETAGFLTELGYDTTVAIRSIPLRGFDRQCAEKVVLYMKEIGTKFLEEVVPIKIEKNDMLKVEFSDGTSDIFNTVMYATGRHPNTKNLNLEQLGIKLTETGKIIADKDTTNIPSIHAIGDVVYGRPELTPTAIKAGILLVRRLFSDSQEYPNYDLVPTTVFTPMEYGSIGLSSEAAIKKYGQENIEEFLSEFSTLEIAASHRTKSEQMRENEYDTTMSHNCLAKLIVAKNLNNRVIGLHFVGPNAGEVVQGYTIALMLGATKQDFDNMLGIHPTDSEIFAGLEITKSSGESWVSSGGCGGGKCG